MTSPYIAYKDNGPFRCKCGLEVKKKGQLFAHFFTCDDREEHHRVYDKGLLSANRLNTKREANA